MKLKIKNKISGFTLAEALFLLYMTVIAIMLSIPIIKIASNENYPKKWHDEYYKILEAQSVKPQTSKQNPQPPMPFGIAGIVFSDDVIKNIESNLDVEKDCGDSPNVCGTDPAVALGKGDKNVYSTLSGGHLDEGDLSKHQVLLKDGANIYCGESRILASSLWVDVNGYKNGPNKLGVDLFGLIVTGKGIIPMGMKDTSANQRQAGDCSKNDQYVPVTFSGGASDYAGATCSYTRLFQQQEQ